MSKEIKLIIRPDGVAEQYDDTYDLTIHCTSEDEQREILKIMGMAAKLRAARCSDRQGCADCANGIRCGADGRTHCKDVCVCGYKRFETRSDNSRGRRK